MKKILVTVSNDLFTDQRVAKICSSLVDFGYEVELIGRRLPNSQSISRSYSTRRLRLLSTKGFLFYAEFNLRLLFVLLFSKKHILWANDLDTLVPNMLVSRLQRKKLVFDSHELFSEVPELVSRPFPKKVWKTLENLLIPKLKNCCTVSEGIANYYQEKYSCTPVVLKNLPIKHASNSTPLPIATQNKKIILYQGALNKGRGLELMIETMTLLPEYILVLFGDGDLREELVRLAAVSTHKNQIYFLGKVNPEQLKCYTPNATVGISLEEDVGLNYRFALPNKLFDYIQAEIPVVVSNLPEMRAVVETHHIGTILKERSPKALADCIRLVTTTNYANALANAKNTLTWDTQEKHLKTFIEHLA